MANRKKDWAEKQTDKDLQELEARIYREYQQAYENVKSKFEEYTKRFAEEDKVKIKQVEDGVITQKEYTQWKATQIIVGNRWQALQNNLAEDLTMVDKKVASIIGDYLPEAYADNFNYSTYEIEKNIRVDTSFTLYSRETVEKLFREGEIQLPKSGVEIPEDKKWNKRHISSAVMQGILSGDDIPTIATRLQQVTDMDRRGAIRNARTLMTGAQNAGRIDAYQRMADLGINVKKQWLATLDSRTRDSHARLDGEIADLKDKFSNGLMEPGDPNGDGSEIYNCRCTLVPYFPDDEDEELERYDQSTGKNIKYVTYTEWAKAKKTPVSNVVNGKDISVTWQRRPELFDFEIEDVINAQGFDGLPRVVSEDEFNKAVEKSSFIAQRSYSAPDQETLDTYRDMLYNGKWYVDCSTGGAQYGQGMYCAADYNGKLSQGILNEMMHYRQLGEERIGNYAATDEQKIAFLKDWVSKNVSKEYQDDALPYLAFQAGIGDFDFKSVSAAAKRLGSYADELFEISSTVRQEAFLLRVGGHSYTETLTLDPSAKIITFNDLIKMKSAEMSSINTKIRDEIGHMMVETTGFKGAERDYLLWGLNISENIEPMDFDKAVKFGERLSKEEKEKYRSIRKEIEEAISKETEKSGLNKLSSMDYGSYAALKGYDAINAEGHGQSASYTVILNRTKLIIKEDKP